MFRKFFCKHLTNMLRNFIIVCILLKFCFVQSNHDITNGTGHVTGMTDRTVTIPNTVATESAAGLMSAADKKKLNGLEALLTDEEFEELYGAQVINVDDDYNT